MNAFFLPRAELFLAIALCAFSLAVHGADVVRIDIDARRASPMPELMRAGVFTFKPDPPAYAIEQWLSEMRPGVVEIDIGGQVFQLSEDREDALRRAQDLLPLLIRIQAAGGEPVLAITRIPVWLSSRPKALETVEGDVVPKASIVAPRDGKEWSALVSSVVTVFKKGLGRTPDIKIGWEPDQSAWQGSEAEFFAFYRDTVSGVKRADPGARVGGPSVSALFNGKGGESAPPLLPRFLRYCALTPLPELGMTRLPVDFLIWHQFGTDFVRAWDLAANQARAWLKGAGYPETTELFIGEWSSWLTWPNPDSAEQDRPALAAYIVASLAAMDHAGIGRAAFTSLLEQREVEAQPFIGSFGLFTNQFIKKPSYWAFLAIGRLGGTRLAARSSDPFVSAIAGKPLAREVAIVVATSTPGDRALQRTFLARLLSSGISFDQIRRELNGQQIERLLAGNLSPVELRLSEPLRQALDRELVSAVSLTQSSRAVRGRVRRLAVDLAGFDLAGADIEIWRIDGQHANALRLRERISSYLQQRLGQEKQALGPGLLQHFNERNYRPEQIEAFKQVMSANNREAALMSRAAPERRIIRSMADESQRYIHERLSRLGEEINAWPELAFKSDEQLLGRAGKSIEFDMEDDSVVLLRIVRR